MPRLLARLARVERAARNSVNIRLLHDANFPCFQIKAESFSNILPNTNGCGLPIVVSLREGFATDLVREHRKGAVVEPWHFVRAGQV